MNRMHVHEYLEACAISSSTLYRPSNAWPYCLVDWKDSIVSNRPFWMGKKPTKIMFLPRSQTVRFFDFFQIVSIYQKGFSVLQNVTLTTL